MFVLISGNRSSRNVNVNYYLWVTSNSWRAVWAVKIKMREDRCVDNFEIFSWEMSAILISAQLVKYKCQVRRLITNGFENNSFLSQYIL